MLRRSERAPARSVRSSDRAGTRRAGARPNRTPLASETPSANSSTRQSSPTSSARGRLPGQNATNGRRPIAARAIPSTPPETPSTRLSVRHWRTRRPRPAPSATRMASSRSRETARASMRLAMFTQAISSTRLTAPSSSHSVPRTSSTRRPERVGDEDAALVGFRVLLREAAANQRQLGLRLGELRAGTDARQHPDAVSFAVLHVRGGVLTERSVQVEVVSEQPEARGEDADDGVSFAVEDQRRAHGRRTGAEAALPKRITDDGHGRRAGAVLLRKERPAEQGSNAENEAAGRTRSRGRLRFRDRRACVTVPPPKRHAGERQ